MEGLFINELAVVVDELEPVEFVEVEIDDEIEPVFVMVFLLKESISFKSF